MASQARLDLKLEQEDKELFSRAAALMGTSVAGFLRTAAKEKAKAIVEQETRLTLSQRDFQNFTTALDKAFEPNRALRAAMETARQRVRRA